MLDIEECKTEYEFVNIIQIYFLLATLLAPWTYKQLNLHFSETPFLTIRGVHTKSINIKQ